MGFNSVHVSSGEFRSESSAEKMILLMTTLRASVKPKNKEGVRAAAEDVGLEHTKRQVKAFFSSV